MNAFRILLVAILIVIVPYTAVVIMNHGLGFLPVFLGDLLKMGWAGQFNVDFLALLVLSGAWLAWRHQFSPGGIALGVLTVLFGPTVLIIYLLYTSGKVGGDARKLLLGDAN